MAISTIDNNGANLGQLGNRNLIINGSMAISQRLGSTVYAQINDGYSLDRFKGNSYDGGLTTGKYTVQQSTTSPDGFSFSMLITSTASTSDNANNIFDIEQKIEGFNTAHLGFGTSSAKTVTLSFWVRSSLTGTFGGAVKNEARNRAYPFSYTISSANTFEHKTIVIEGDTSGTWVGATSGTGLWISFGLGVGSTRSGTAGAWGGGDMFSSTGATSIVGTNGATLYLTGVKLEEGNEATDFQHVSYGEEMAKCQRYYQHQNAFGAYLHVNYEQKQSAFTFTKMRAAPTATRTSSFNSGTEYSSTITILNETSGRVVNTNMGVGGKYNLDAEI